jgi:hypothetical protein
LSEDRVEALARKLLRNPEENGLEPGDTEGALRMAAGQLEASDQRQTDPAAFDHEHDGAIRRTSSETSSVGDTQTRRQNVQE